MKCAAHELAAATDPFIEQPILGSGNSEDPNSLAGEDWPALRLGALPPATAFPVDVFPKPVANFIKTVSASIGCPPDFVGLPALVVAGATIGRTVHLELKRNRNASASLYALSIGGPSSGKPPALKTAVYLLLGVDERLRREHAQKMVAYRAEMDAYESAGKDTKPTKPIQPTAQTALVEDATTEALVQLLAQNPRGLLQVRDEGSAWVKSFGQYKGGRGADREFYMSALFGSPIKVNRKGSSDLAPIYASEPFLSVVGNLPPDVLSLLQEESRSDGFFERILFAYPEPIAMPEWSDDGIPDFVLEEWNQIIARLRLYELPPQVDGKRAPCLVRLSPDAKEVWTSAYNRHIRAMNAELSEDGKAAGVKLRLLAEPDRVTG